jgi:hypothetical protein
MTDYKTVVNVPKLANPSLAVKLWYEQVEIGSGDIREIFGCCPTTARKLKLRAREQMEMDECMSFNSKNVNVICAYKSWGIDVKRLERGLDRPKLRLTEKTE